MAPLDAIVSPCQPPIRMTTAPKYRAFLSYSHADEAMARYLHARLERYTIDPAIVPGAAKGKLAPVFLDRMGFSGGRPLTDETIEKLDDCAALILLASPASFASKPVREEVETFQTRHPDRPIIPVILSGSAKTVFPPCLPTGTLAVDWNKDNAGLWLPHAWAARLDRTRAWRLPRWLGWGDLAFAKLVAGLLGVKDPDEIFRREKRRTRQQAAVFVLIAALIVGLGSSVFMKQRELSDPAAIASRLLAMKQAQAAEPGELARITRAVQDIAEAANTDPRSAQVLALLKAGKTIEAGDLQEAVAWSRKTIAVREQKQAAKEFRSLGAIKGLADPKKSREAYAEAARLDPDDIDGMQWHAYMEQEAGNLGEAETANRQVIGRGRPGKDDVSLYWAHLGLGDALVSRGNLDTAVAEYNLARSIAEHLAQADPGNAGWQRDLSVSHTKLGDVLVAQGNLTEALTAYRASLAIAERLAQADPGNADWQRDLSVSHDRLGDVLVAQGNLTEALTAYRARHAIAERLAQADPGNAGWQRDLSVSFSNLANVLTKQEKYAEALDYYRLDFGIAERLAKTDPMNAEWQRDLAVSHYTTAVAAVRAKELAQARDHAKAGQAIIVALIRDHPGVAQWETDLTTFTKLVELLK